jgi:hypothetical protein
MPKLPQNALKEAEKAAKEKDRQGNKLIAALALWHSDIVRTFEQSIVDGLPIVLLTARQFDELEQILKRHYESTSKAFSSFKLSVQAGKTELTKQTQANIIRQVETLIQSAPERLQSIKNTTENQKEQAYMAARKAFLEEGESNPSNQALAIATGNILRNRLKNHRAELAISETNWVVEGTRQAHVTISKQPISESLNEVAAAINVQDKNQAEKAANQTQELSALTESNTAKEAGEKAKRAAGILSFFQATQLRSLSDKVVEQIKMWITMGDNRVRQSHRGANGQRRHDTEPFQVGSSLLMYPADGSLGAEIKELVRCRCFVYYL